MVEVKDVERVDGRVVKMVAWIGTVESRWVRWPETGEPFEESRTRYDVQVLDRESLRIPDSDNEELERKVAKIFSEDRSKSRSLKKTLAGVQGKFF
jgi:hypothetical protein